MEIAKKMEENGISRIRCPVSEKERMRDAGFRDREIAPLLSAAVEVENI